MGRVLQIDLVRLTAIAGVEFAIRDEMISPSTPVLFLAVVKGTSPRASRQLVTDGNKIWRWAAGGPNMFRIAGKMEDTQVRGDVRRELKSHLRRWGLV